MFMVSHDEIEAVIALAKQHGLAELHVQYSAKTAVTVKLPIAHSQPVLSTTASTTPLPNTVADTLKIRAPMVGTVYLRPKPEQPPFVSKGQQVNKGDTLCMIEAMKMFNKILADRDGVIADILVEDASGVSYDTPLFIWQD